MKYILLIFILTNNVEVDINMLKLVYLAELVYINLKYIASNASLMMSLSIGYPQILASGYPDSKFTIRFSPNIQCWFLDGRASILDLLTQSSKIAAKPQVLGSKCLTGRLI